MQRTAAATSAPTRSRGMLERERLRTTASIRAMAFAALIVIARAVIAWARLGEVGRESRGEDNSAMDEGRKAR
jgi:hypothetical protein